MKALNQAVQKSLSDKEALFSKKPNLKLVAGQLDELYKLAMVSEWLNGQKDTDQLKEVKPTKTKKNETGAQKAS